MEGGEGKEGIREGEIQQRDCDRSRCTTSAGTSFQTQEIWSLGRGHRMQQVYK